MIRMDKAMIEKTLDLIFEFERYVAGHPAFAEKIPDDAVVVLQVKGDEAFNRWNRRIAEKQAKEKNRPVVHITISKMGPVRSRIEALKVERAAWGGVSWSDTARADLCDLRPTVLILAPPDL